MVKKEEREWRKAEREKNVEFKLLIEPYIIYYFVIFLVISITSATASVVSHVVYNNKLESSNEYSVTVLYKTENSGYKIVVETEIGDKIALYTNDVIKYSDFVIGQTYRIKYAGPKCWKPLQKV